VDGTRQVSGALRDEPGEPTVGEERQGFSGEGGSLSLSFLTGLRSRLLCHWASVEAQENATRTESKASVPSTRVDVRDTYSHLFLSFWATLRPSVNLYKGWTSRTRG